MIQAKLLWTDLVTLPTVDSAMSAIAATYDFKTHPYLLWMQADTTDAAGFRQSQLPFRFAVESFSQALAAVLARIPSLEQRLPLFLNVAEEHGNGDRQMSHKASFQQYLEALGATAADLETPCPTPIFAFNQSVLTYCLTQEVPPGAALLGAIEFLYVGISATIAHTILERGWVAPGSQSHYSTHERLDTHHSADLLALTATAWDQRDGRQAIAQSLLLGAYYFWRLYDELLPSQ
ncbi:hypothetical protein E1H12_13720 [Geitlerinema sp. P-1104]|nr:hypothetical protein [Geitlerinema sp. P-1104]